MAETWFIRSIWALRLAGIAVRAVGSAKVARRGVEITARGTFQMKSGRGDSVGYLAAGEGRMETPSDA